MSALKYETGVILGRFQPFREQDWNLLKNALDCSQQVIVILGSADSARSLRNPFTVSERKALIEAHLSSHPTLKERVKFATVQDHFYQDHKWVQEVHEKVQKLSKSLHSTGFFYFENDSSASYQEWFSGWTLELIKCPQELHSSKLRENYLRKKTSIESAQEISEETRKWLRQFAQTPAYEILKEEQGAIDVNQKQWSQAPYPPIFVTTDSIVTQAGHLLLIRRKNAPAKGLWALPGGFLDQDEILLDCAIRELKEETRIEVSKETLIQSLVATQTFDHPLRSDRKRTITHAYDFRLKGSQPADMNPGDDAAEARWVRIEDLEKMRTDFAEDHYHIVQYFLQK